MIIDFHTHIFSQRIKDEREKYLDCDPLFKLLYSDLKARLATADDLVRSMDEQGVEISVVQSIAWSSPQLCYETNDYIMESVARYPERLVGFGMVVLDSPEASIKEIERCLKGGIKGVGEIRPERTIIGNTELIKPVIQKIIDSNLILLTHASEPVGHIYSGKGDMTPESLYPFIASFPGLKLVCAHWGGGLPFYGLMPEVRKALENVYFDSAASPYLYQPQIYPQVAQLVGPEKILFGSDYPLLKPKRLLAEIEALNLPEEVKAQILAGNAIRLLRGK